MGMFVNEAVNKRTVDHERNVELRYLGSGPERPETFSLTVHGTPIAFEVEARDTITTDGRQALAWRVLSIGKGHLSFSGDVRHKIPGHSFADAGERKKICSLIDEALRVYSNFYGMVERPVTEVSFLPAEPRG